MAKRFGMNIAGPGENFENTYADALRQHRGWARPGKPWEPDPTLPVDHAGEPLADFAFSGPVLAKPCKPYLAGTYELSFVGQAKLGINANIWPATITRQAYHRASNTTTAIVVVPPSNDNGVAITFTETRRLPTDRPGTGLARIKFMRPITVGSARFHHRDELFNRDWLTALRDFELIRGMDWLQTNSYGPPPRILTATWATRTVPGLANQSPWIAGRTGACIEDLVEAANLANVDLYVNLPDTADRDYITKFMQLVAFGSNGFDPYTAPEARPVYRGLKPGLKFYFAWSNEVWNFSFIQAARNDQNARAEVAAGGSPLNYDGATDPSVWFRRRVGDHLKTCSEIARKVFGDAAMMTRVRPVLESFIHDSNTLSVPLDFLNGYYNNGDGIAHVKDPHPPSYYIWGGGGGGYRNPANKTADGNAQTANAIFASGLEPMSHAGEVQILTNYGLEHASYEMGFNIGEHAVNEFTSKLTSDPRSGPMAEKTLTDYYADGGSLGIIYSVSTGCWRNLDEIARLDHPKYLGLKRARQNPPTEAIRIPAVPSTDSNPSFHGQFKPGDALFAKAYRFPTGGYLTYNVAGYQLIPPGKPSIKVTVDGRPAATAELISGQFGAGRGWSGPIVVPVGPGLHTIRLTVTEPIVIPFGPPDAMTFSPAPPPTVSRQVFATSQFAGAAGTPFPKTAEGARWAKQAGGNDFVATGKGGLRITGSGYGNEIAHFLNEKPPSADYEVAATFDLAGFANNRFYLTIRGGVSPTIDGYCGGIDGSSFRIFKYASNSSLATNEANLNNFTGTVRLRLRATGSLIQLFVNDFEVCRATDTAYTQPGHAGFYFAQNTPATTVIRSFELATIRSTPSDLVSSLVKFEPGAKELTLVAGRPQTMAVKVTPPALYQGEISLKLDDLPGVVGSFDPPVLPGAGTSTLTLIPADATRFADRPLILTALAGPASVTTTGTVRATRTPPPSAAKVSLFVPPGIVGVPAQGEIGLHSDPLGTATEANLHFTGAVVPESVTIPAGATFAPFPCTPTASIITGAVALQDLAAWSSTRQTAFETPRQEGETVVADQERRFGES